MKIWFVPDWMAVGLRVPHNRGNANGKYGLRGIIQEFPQRPKVSLFSYRGGG